MAVAADNNNVGVLAGLAVHEYKQDNSDDNAVESRKRYHACREDDAHRNRPEQECYTSGSFIAVRKRTIESAPTIPSESTTLLVTARITTVVMSVSATRVVPKMGDQAC